MPVSRGRTPTRGRASARGRVSARFCVLARGCASAEDRVPTGSVEWPEVVCLREAVRGFRFAKIPLATIRAK